MNYEAFKTYVKESMEAVTGEKVEIYPVVKNNSLVLDGLCIQPREGKVAVPTIYLEGYFDAYENGTPAAELVREMLEFYDEKKKKIQIDPENFRDFSKMESRIMFKVINREKNGELLKKIPHKSFLDLEIVYYVLFLGGELGDATMLVENSHLEVWGVTAGRVHQAAVQNTPRLLKGSIRGMDEVMGEMLLSDIREEVKAKMPKYEARGICLDEEGIDRLCISMVETVKKRQERIPMYVLSNERNLYGAACMFYEDLLKECARRIQGSFYILPSSVHELLLMPVKGLYSSRELSRMVKEINDTQISPEEILADHVYIYHQKLGKITM